MAKVSLDYGRLLEFAKQMAREAGYELPEGDWELLADCFPRDRAPRAYLSLLETSTRDRPAEVVRLVDQSSSSLSSESAP